jgi:hypothetical protein
VSKKFDVEILEFCLFANTEKQSHSWFISLDKKIDKKLIMKELDKELGELNDDYKTCRLHNLNPPNIEFIDVSKFYNYLEKIGKSGSQNKFPRVLNNEQAKNWISYLEEN